MTTLAVRHTVADFDVWLSTFKEHEKVRRSHGAIGHRVLRNGNDLLVLVDFPDAAGAASFQADPSLAEAMQKGGVVGAPDGSLWTESTEERY